MADTHPRYEAVVGLEVHVQLNTASKLFSRDSTAFGAEPNSQAGTVTLAHPGTLPHLNMSAVEKAVRLGLALECEIAPYSVFARKNYFYPDLPKGYQISQHEHPICLGGRVKISTEAGQREIRLHHIHLEEDAGKSLHDLDPDATCLDFNRAGTPLLEIVTEPDLRSAEEASAFLAEVRRIVRWIGVCDGNMEEGSLRCDANVSIRPHGESRLGTRVEVKNLNSIRHLRLAVEGEVARLASILDAGGRVLQETRGFDSDRESTFSIRVKENADDYRYFPEPDLPPVQIGPAFVEKVRSSMPALPEELFTRFVDDYRLPEYDARQLCEEKELCDLFLGGMKEPGMAKPLANWLLGPVRSHLNEKGLEWSSLMVSADSWAGLIGLVESGSVSFSAASHRILPLLLQGDARPPDVIARELDLLQDAGQGEIESWVDEVMAAMTDKVAEYRKGKKGLIGLFTGEVRKRSRGKADPVKTQQILMKKLNA
jgi:aspartyl-tRNA(Asn)/glutamyl-tRNA(Gln) amidotransferase subunit B